ncbi:MAG: hypothetical protein J5676_11020 [Bacteroidaceae bacterium]|nr:hypothetical protein [Bacteroidaceae bacterium]
MMGIININKIMGFAAALVCLTACTDVELFEEDNYKELHRAVTTIDYNGTEWKSAPDSMYVFASRITLPTRTCYRVNVASLEGDVIHGDIAEMDEIESPKKGFYLRHSQYHFMTFNIANGVESNYKDYIQDPNKDEDIRKLYIGYPSSDIKSPFPTTYYAVEKVYEVDEDNHHVTFSPRKMGQDITINLSMVKASPDFTVKSIEGSISGIPSKLYLTTRYVDAKNCYSMNFDSGKFSAGLAQQESVDTCRFTLKFNAIALHVTEEQYHNYDVSPNAPGVLRLNITTVDNVGEERVLKAVIGLYCSITEANSLKLADNDADYKLTDNEAPVVNVVTPLILDSDEIIEENKPNVDVWKKDEN